MRLTRKTALAAALLGAIALAACGEQTLDSADLEQQLTEQLGEQAGAEPRSVDCPDDIAVEQGRQFDCTLVAPNGDEVTVNVELTNDEGGFEAVVAPQEAE